MNDMIKEMLDEFDYDVFVGKGLYENDELTDRYYILVKNYKILLDKYLMNKLPLKDMDNEIINSGLSFIPVEKEKMDFYQKFSAMKLKYLYLRNNLYVYKLSNSEIDTLVNLTDNQLAKPSAKLMELIDDTYRMVIDAKPYGDDVSDVYMKCYGIDDNDYWLKSDELVIGLRYDEFADNGLGDGDEWVDNYNNQLEFLGNLMKNIENKCCDILGFKVNILYYDDVIVENTMGRNR